MSILYAAQGGSGASDLYTVDPATGAITSVGPIGFAVTGLAFDPTSGVLYGVTSNLSPVHVRSLISVDISTGAGTFIGSLGLSAPLGDIAFLDDGSGTLYGYGGASSKRSLYTINKATGAATLVHSNTVGGGVGNGFEIDAFPNGVLSPSSDGGLLYAIRMNDGRAFSFVTLAGAGFNGVNAMSFGPDSLLYAWLDDGSGDSQLCTIHKNGAVTTIGSSFTPTAPLDALAWDTQVRPNFFYDDSTATTDFDETFNTTVVGWDCVGPPKLSTDGHTEGTKSLKVDARSADSYLIANPPPDVPGDGNWIYTSFALCVPSWSALDSAGVTPTLLELTGGAFDAYDVIVATSPTTGVIESGNGSDSTAVPDGSWCAVEVARCLNSAAHEDLVRFWVDGVDSGILHEPYTSAPGPTSGLQLGDTSWGGGPPPDAVTYYVDDFHWSGTRVGPVDITGAVFGGIGSGADIDACAALEPEPVDDSYSTGYATLLTVAAPGVLGNDVLPTTATLNAYVAHGSLMLDSDGSFTYLPDSFFSGVDTFTYDGNGGTATVSITVGSTRPLHPIFDGSPFFKAEP